MAKKIVDLKGYLISITVDGKYTLSTLPEALCRKMCECIDQGGQWSPSSRYNYTTELYKKTKKGFCWGTAKAAVQYAIIEKLKYKNGNRININTPPA